MPSWNTVRGKNVIINKSFQINGLITSMESNGSTQCLNELMQVLKDSGFLKKYFIDQIEIKAMDIATVQYYKKMKR